jgi:flagella basal body P-ring formation protein FlgA
MARLTRVTCWATMVATIIAISTSLNAAEFRLREEVRTTKSLLLLGDVVEIYSSDSQEASKLASLELTPAPAVGNRTHLRLSDVQDLLAFRGIDLTKHRFSGASQVTVIRATDTPNKTAARRPNKGLLRLAQRLATDAIVRHLRENVADEGWQVTVEINDDQAQAIAALSEPPVASGGESPWVGRQQFELIVQAGDGPQRLSVAAQVALPPAIVVAIHAVPRGATVRAGDIQLQRLAPGATAAGSFQTAEEVVGKEAVKAIAPGQMLDANYVRPPVLVHNGEVVTVYGRNAGIVVRMPARAHENGAQGELVSVESLLDRKTILARVCGLQEVEVFGGAANTSPATLTAEREDRTKRSE